ncbi:hypothetical protein AB0907_24140 [Streptomyces sp. NPDC006975]|uniref:hypothetical protein n=1 Tax=Streptomyces sp. NPDC006975 TaxID=3154310 RepID=UPI003455EA70
MTEPLSPEREQEIRESIPTVYRAPWTVHPDWEDDTWRVMYATDHPLAGLVAVVPDYGSHLAEFIATARTAVPELLDEIDRLRALLTASRAAAFHEAADAIDVDDECDCGGCDSCQPRKLAAMLRERAAALRSTPAADADFFQPGHTYAERGGWRFRCDTITSHPADGELTALGWRFHAGRWEPIAYHRDDWETHRAAGHIDGTAQGGAP